jgi:hypothetical protein
MLEGQDKFTMPHPTLDELIKKLQAIVSANQNQSVLNNLGAEIQRRILLKHSRLSQYNNIYQLQQWATLVGNAPNQINTYLTDPDFLILVKRDIDIVHNFSQTTPSLYSRIHQITLNVDRYPTKMIFTNPHSVGYRSLQSWSRPKSISISYGHHLPSSRSRKKSKFQRGIDIKTIEYALFSDAYGILYNSDKIFLYGAFSSPIGKLPSPNNNTTKFVKMQVDRVRRLVGTGFRVEFHSYPIDQNQLQQDFGSNHPMINYIQNNVFQI